jgi:triosephosphate isomerase
LRTPLIIINTKNYIEVSGDRILKLVRDTEYVASQLRVELVIAPPISSIGVVGFKTFLPVLSQHVDPVKLGSSTGSVVPEMIKDLGVTGSLLNHSEKRISFDILEKTIHRLKMLGLVSVACARSVEEVSQIAGFEPDFIAIEPPELIGSGVAVSKVKPEVVSNSVDAVRKVNKKVKVICGAGIVNGADVEASLQLGAQGVLVASGIIKSPNWREKITELGNPLKQ